MQYSVQMIINRNPYFKKYLRDNSFYYKRLIRKPDSYREIIESLRQEYKLTLPDKLDKIKNNISLLNTFMDVMN